MQQPESSTCHLCTIRDDPGSTPFARLLPDRDPGSQVLFRDADCLVIIDVAPVGPGHCIIVPVRHRLSLAQTTEREKSAIIVTMSAVASAISSAFSREPVFFEHGQCVEGIGVTGCGISHAHLHAVARSEGAALARVGDLTLEPISGGIGSLSRYRSDDGYLFVQDGDGNAFATRPTSPVSGVLRSHFAWPKYLAEASHRGWPWSDHLTYAALVGTASRVAANLDALESIRVGLPR
jgi:diadenosine tetraphosphate (Ap4A) HIT family hydrolase